MLFFSFVFVALCFFCGAIFKKKKKTGWTFYKHFNLVMIVAFFKFAGKNPTVCLQTSSSSCLCCTIFYFELTRFTYTVVFCKYPCATLQLNFFNIQDSYKMAEIWEHHSIRFVHLTDVPTPKFYKLWYV